MFTLEGIQKFHSWTHASVTLVLDHVSTIPPSGYTQVLPGFGSPTIREQVVHIFNCEGFWIRVLQGLPPRDRTLAECPGIPEARRLQKEVGGQTMAYLSGLTEQQLNSNAELHFPDGDIALRTPALIPPPSTDPHVPSQGPDRGHVPRPGPSRARYRSEPVRMTIVRSVHGPLIPSSSSWVTPLPPRIIYSHLFRYT